MIWPGGKSDMQWELPKNTSKDSIICAINTNKVKWHSEPINDTTCMFEYRNGLYEVVVGGELIESVIYKGEVQG